MRKQFNNKHVKSLEISLSTAVVPKVGVMKCSLKYMYITNGFTMVNFIHCCERDCEGYPFEAGCSIS